MADQDNNQSNITDLATIQQSGVRYLGQLVQAIQNTFPRINGTFTLAAAVTTTIPNTAVTSTSIISLMPTNAAAGTLMGSAKSLYISARTSGASFAISTANAVAAAGTETFSYTLVNPS